MKEYLDIVNTILTKGKKKSNRTGIDTIACPNIHFSHDMSKGFPLLTTKRMAKKAMLVELEGFIGGITDKKWFQKRGCKIWDEWSNPKSVDRRMIQWQNENANRFKKYKDCVIESEKLRKNFQKEESDLGPIYGYQWRRFGREYTGPNSEAFSPALIYDDQFAEICRKLKTNPNDRRLVCSAWSPLQLEEQALPPCHLGFVLTHIDGELSLHWTQRSCDTALGIPFNIASYGMLLTLFCKHANLEPGNLSGMFCDCHIYENQVEGMKEQLKREPKKLPQVDIPIPDNDFDIFKWTHQDVAFLNYEAYDNIDFGGVAV